MSRRAKGTGCITEIKNGKYKYRGLLTIGTNKNGNPKKKVFYGNTKKEVNDKINLFLSQDMPEKLDKITYDKALDLLISSSKENGNKLKTMSIIETTCNILRNKWGYFSLDKIFNNDVKRQFNEWGKIYSYSQLCKLRNYGKKAFYLICNEYDLNYKNPFDIVIKSENLPPKSNFFTEEELYKIDKKC